MTELTLTEKDRMFLVNQYRILSKLFPEKAKIYDQGITILEEGYEFEYGSLPGCVDPEPLTFEDCKWVHSILKLYRKLKSCYQALEDKGGIDPKKLEFPGFDANGDKLEGRYLAYGEFLNSTGRFPEIQVNETSNGPCLSNYRRMLDEWKPLRNKPSLDAEDIRRILEGKIHSSRRREPV